MTYLRLGQFTNWLPYAKISLCIYTFWSRILYIQSDREFHCWHLSDLELLVSINEQQRPRPHSLSTTLTVGLYQPYDFFCEVPNYETWIDVLIPNPCQHYHIKPQRACYYIFMKYKLKQRPHYVYKETAPSHYISLCCAAFNETWFMVWVCQTRTSFISILLIYHSTTTRSRLWHRILWCKCYFVTYVIKKRQKSDVHRSKGSVR